MKRLEVRILNIMFETST